MNTIIDTCTCGTLGAPAEIRMCVQCHKYWYGDQRLESVTRVISSVMPTDYSKIDPAVLENARDRGERIDRYFTQYLNAGNVSIAMGERADVVDRLSRLIDFCDAQGFEVLATQKIVYSKMDGIAGMLDIEVACGDHVAVIDLKCVSALQPSYKLQLGAYLNYSGAAQCSIVHLTKDKVRLVAYDASYCREAWNTAKAWWMRRRELESK